ncbi:MAG: YeeE/YedE family protein [Bacteroidetes bacterium]|nr:YeeE/YedE family protein [Bacteroidota bacterium]
MGPLIPQGFVDIGWSYVIALLVGLAFGYILESSGFSSSRKMIGMFYGYDFTVLKVFFTATITAMIGLLYFNYMEWIDLSMIYIPPTYVKSAIVGGLIMGLGFVLGGFCPGTGVCAVAIGKLDAITFVIGLYLGIFLFSEAFPILKNLYTDSSLGRVKITETLGIQTGVFVFLFIVAALIAFGIATYVQKKVKSVDY